MNTPDPTVEKTGKMIDDLTEDQAKFILHASVLAGHLPDYWLRQGIELARMVRYD